MEKRERQYNQKLKKSVFQTNYALHLRSAKCLPIQFSVKLIIVFFKIL